MGWRKNSSAIKGRDQSRSLLAGKFACIAASTHVPSDNPRLTTASGMKALKFNARPSSGRLMKMW